MNTIPTSFQSRFYGRLMAWATAVFTTLVLALPSGCAPDQGAAAIAVSTQALTGSDVTRVTVTITGTGISPSITQELSNSGGQWRALIGGIPAGTGRNFAAQAYDATNTLRYQGEVTGVTVSSGTQVVVAILPVSSGMAPRPTVHPSPKCPFRKTILNRQS